MKILLIIAETPFINEWFAQVVRHMSAPPYSIEFVLYFNSELSYRDNQNLFPSNIKCYHYPSDSEPKHPVPIAQFDWSVAFVSWERQWHHRIFKYDERRILAVLGDLYGVVSQILSSERPDFVLYENPSSILGEVFYTMCAADNCSTYLSVSQSRIPDRIEFFDLKYRFSLFNPPLEDDDRARFLQLNNDYIAGRLRPSYMLHKANASLHSVGVFWHYISKPLRLLFFLRNASLLFGSPDYETQEAYGMLFATLKNHSLRRIRQKFFRNRYTQPVSGERFLLFPMHLVPESSVSGQATYFSDLITTIRYIAFSLPMGTMLYVKEHPSAIGTRNTHFYREIAYLPNVRLIASSVSNQSLIDASVAIITLTSTLGMEAALRGKTVYMLGESFYDFHPCVIRIRNFEELRAQLKCPINDLNAAELSSSNIAFWNEYLSHTITGNMLDKGVVTDFDSLHRLLLMQLSKSSTGNNRLSRGGDSEPSVPVK